MDRSTIATQIAPGQEIFTHDGQRLGTVKEVDGDRFKVDASMQPDYWLECNDVTACEADTVRMGLASTDSRD
ncbi:MAG: DUF2171 domain-containing protein [Dehalococcoidia bacterium]|nr:DUF2171 domain-containing protein [Dehalococcoidia bacterium]